MKVKLRRLEHARDLPPPSKSTPGSAGYDLRAALIEPLTLEPGERALVPTGLVLEIPEGWEAQVRPRSGLALRHGITLLNTPGTIDSDYRGEIGVIVIHHGHEPFTIERGTRIAQLVLARTENVEWEEAEDLAESHRGGGGFGSTGTG